MSLTQDGRIVQDVLRGDVDAYSALVLEYQKPVFNLMLRLTGSVAEAADLTQDAFVRAYERLDQFRTSCRFFPWLYTIAMNLARDWARKHRPEVLEDNIDRHPDGDGSRTATQERLLQLKQDKEAVNRALAELPLEHREAVILHYREGLSMKELSVVFNLSVSGAKMRVNRGVGMLRVILSENGHGKM